MNSKTWGQLEERGRVVNVEIERLIDVRKSETPDVPRLAAKFYLHVNRTYQKGFITPWRQDLSEVETDLEELVTYFEVVGKDSDTMNIFSTDLFAYITAEMIEHAGRVTLTITNVTLEDLENARGKETKPVVHFKERDKTWVLNKTNAKDLAAVLGPETDNWQGARVVLTTERINAFGKYMPVIRIANVTPAAKPKQTARPVADGPVYGDGSEVSQADVEMFLSYVEEHGEVPHSRNDVVAEPTQPALVDEPANGAYQD